MAVSEAGIPAVYVDPMVRHCSCQHLQVCREQYQIMEERLIGKYIASDSPSNVQIVAAWLPLKDYSFQSYVKELRGVHKGNAQRQANKADRAGLFCSPFTYALHVPDIVAVNLSLPVRSGRLMTPQYCRNIEEMGGAPVQSVQFEWPACPIHYEMWWGIFNPESGYKQGGVQVDKRLVGYIRLRRNGNYAFYSQILGHGDYLRQGIMYRLHLALIKWFLESGHPATLGLESLVYAGYYQGQDGLRMWKKRALFRPARLVVSSASLAALLR